MPKVRPLTQQQREKAEDDANNEYIRQQILGILAYCGITQTTLAPSMGITRPTLHRRMKDPSTFTLSDLRKIRRIAEAHGLQFNY